MEKQLKLFDIKPIEKEFNCYDCFYSYCKNEINIWNLNKVEKIWFCNNYDIYLKANVDNIHNNGDVRIFAPRKSKNCKYFITTKKYKDEINNIR